MRLLDRYIIREITPYALMGFLLLSSVIFLHEANRFSELFIVFSRSGQSTGPLFKLVASVIPGPITPEQVHLNLAGFNHPIPADLWRELKAEGLLREDAPTPS